MGTQETTSLLRPLVEDLEARRAKIRLGGGEEKIQKQHDREKLTARERIALLIDEGTFTELGIHGKPALLPARDGRRRRARRRRDHRLRQDRRAAGGSLRVRLHGDGRLDGDDRRDQGHAVARAGADQADAVRLAARLRRRARAGGRRCDVRGLRAPVPRGGRDERRDPADRGADGPVRGGHRLHPGPGGLRADGQGQRVNGARGAAPREGCRRRGRHPGGTGRLARAHAQVGRR